MGEYSTALESKLKALTLSQPAAAWVSKALHPVVGAPCQIPDAVQVSSLVPEYKTNTVVDAPSTLPVNTNWDCLMVFPPSDTIAAYVVTGASGIDFATTLGLSQRVITQSGTGFAGAAGLLGVAFNRTTGANAGAGSYRAAAAVEHPAMWRHSARSATVYATGSDLYNQGTVYAAQYARQAEPAAVGASLIIAGVPEYVAVNVDTVNLPLRESDMSVMTPNMYTAAAREGVYTVHRLTGPAQEFTRPRCPTQWLDPSETAVNFAAYDPTSRTGTTQHVVRFEQDDAEFVSPILPPASEAWFSSGFDNHTSWGVVIFRGLHPLMSLTLKTVCNLEIVPDNSAPSRQFVRQACKYEPTAMAAYYAIASEAPNCMAAKHNFLGTLLPILSSVASKVLPFLAPVLGQGLSALGSHLSTRAEAPRIAAPPPTSQVRARRDVSVASRRSVGSRVSRMSRGNRSVRIKSKRKGGRK
jgi:hypothetical protein